MAYWDSYMAWGLNKTLELCMHTLCNWKLWEEYNYTDWLTNFVTSNTTEMLSQVCDEAPSFAGFYKERIMNTQTMQASGDVEVVL